MNSLKAEYLIKIVWVCDRILWAEYLVRVALSNEILRLSAFFAENAFLRYLLGSGYLILMRGRARARERERKGEIKKKNKNKKRTKKSHNKDVDANWDRNRSIFKWSPWEI